MLSANITRAAVGEPSPCSRVGKASSAIRWTNARSPTATKSAPGCWHGRISALANVAKTLGSSAHGDDVPMRAAFVSGLRS